MFPLAASSSSQHSSDTPITWETWSHLAFPDPGDALSKAFDDRNAVERWRFSTHTKGPQDVSCTPQWDLRSTTESPTDEDLPNQGSLFASRTLPPLSSQILPRPQPYPLLRPSEWTSFSHRRDSGDHFRRLSLQGDGWPPCPVLPLRAPLEGNTLHGAQRSRHSPQELSTDSLVSPASPDTPITFMVPQTGPMPPNFPASESQRRRGFRSRHPPPPPEDAPWIQCGWVGCGVWLVYDQNVISHHVNTHNRGSQELICWWKKPGGGVCGTSMKPVNLRKHTLGIHTALMTVWCEGCGKGQRKDAMSRHKKRCKGDKGGLPKPE